MTASPESRPQRPTKRTFGEGPEDLVLELPGTTQKRACMLECLPMGGFDDDFDLMHWVPDMGTTARSAADIDVEYDYPGIEDDMAALAAIQTSPGKGMPKRQSRPDDRLNECGDSAAFDEHDQEVDQRKHQVARDANLKADCQISRCLAEYATPRQLSPPNDRGRQTDYVRGFIGKDDSNRSSKLENTTAQNSRFHPVLIQTTGPSADRGSEHADFVAESTQPSPSQTKVPSALLLRPYKTFFGLKELLLAKEALYKNQSKAVFEVFARVSHSYRATAGRTQLFALKDLLDNTEQELLGSLVG